MVVEDTKNRREDRERSLTSHGYACRLNVDAFLEQSRWDEVKVVSIVLHP